MGMTAPSPFSRFFRIALLSCVFTAPLNVAAQVGSVAVSDVSAPTADTFGISDAQPTYPAVSWGGSVPQSVENLLISLPSPIQLEPQKELLVHILTLPVLPAEKDAIPAEWLALRLEALHTVGADDAASRLAKTIPENLAVSDRARRAGVDALLRTNHVKEACKLAMPALEQDTGVDPYWPVRITFCHYMRGDTPRAELSWQLAQETHGRQISPMAATLFNQWGVKGAMLPPLTKADAPLEPLLVAGLASDKKTHLSTRIPPNFLISESIFTISPALAGQLATLSILPPIIHFELTEKAASYGLATPAALRSQYDKFVNDVTMWDKLPPEANLRLQAVRRLKHIPQGSSQMAELANAIPLFTQKFGDAFTYRFFSDQMELLHEALEALQPSATLAMDAAANDLLNKDTESAERIARYLDEGSAFPDGKAAAHAIRLAIRLYQGDVPTQVDLNSLPQEAQRSWLTARSIEVLNALGTKVVYPQQQVTGSSPLITAPPSNIMDRLRFAKANRLEAETLLASALLLPNGSLRQVSDSTAYEIVHNLHVAGFTDLARTFAIQFILHAPVTPR